jgi:prepilin-type N-terminal cleavage/methylation domain-containing protein
MDTQKLTIRNSRGVTLVEILMTVAILSIGVLGFVGAFLNISKSIQSSKTRSIATNLVQEKIESLKNLSYYRLIVTTNAVSSTEPGIPTFTYDPSTGFYPPETMNVAGTSFTRSTRTRRVTVGVGGTPTVLSPLDDDSGLKKVTVYVLWQEIGNWEMISKENLRNNPTFRKLRATVSGTVRTTASVSLNGAIVGTVENGSYFGYSDASGAYSFKVDPGSYTLKASLAGYFTTTTGPTYAATSSTVSWSPQLSKMSSGTVTGTAYIRDHLVISQVVGSSQAATIDQEWVEIYNPTTWTWTASDIGLKFQRVSSLDPVPINIRLDYRTPDIAPGEYFLFSNTGTVNAVGTPLPADAVWDLVNPDNFSNFGARFTVGDPNVITTFEDNNQWGAGGVQLYEISSGDILDRVGWEGNGSNQSPPSTVYEGVPIDQNQGLNDTEQFYRRSSASTHNPAQGSAYDTNDNEDDIGILTSVGWVPRSTASGAASPLTGTPAQGAYVSANDGLSGPVQASATGYFSLTSIATGTWTIALSSGTLYKELASQAVGAGVTVSTGNVALDSSTTDGFVTGTVYTTGGSPISGIKMVGVGVAEAFTSATGKYQLRGSTGIATIVANSGNYTPTYVSLSSANVTVDTGQYTTGVNFYLPTGGRILGSVKIGSSPVPDVPVTASTGTTVVQEAVTDSGGNFIIQNLSTGTYSVALQLESGESYSPSGTVVTLNTPGVDVFSSSYSITSAFGTITGSLTAGGSAITTGVLIVATTATIAGSPPDVTAAVRIGLPKYYAGSSLADGTYSVSVPGGTTATNYNVYGWYTTFSGTTPTTVRRNTTAAVLGAQTTSGRDMSW